MTTTRLPVGALRRLGPYVLASVGSIAAAPGDVRNDEEVRHEREGDDDGDELLSGATTRLPSAAPGRTLAVALEHMNPFDATHTATTAALSTVISVRRGIADALAWVGLVGDDVVLDHLARDDDEGVRAAALRALAARSAPILSVGAPASPTHPRVLVVDDYAGGRGAICACLTELECDALGTSSALIARDLPWDELVDVVVADHDPPWSDGEGLVVRIRQRSPDLPAILLCSRSAQEEPHDNAMTGSIWLTKPISLESLSTAIHALVEPRSSRHRPPR